MARILHISTLHSPLDARIFHKECAGLARGGHDVLLLIPGAEEGIKDGVRLIPLRAVVPGRTARPLRVWRAWRQARRIPADLIHIHDPELLPLGLALKLEGRKVVYDSHEDFPRILVARLKSRRSLPSWVLKIFELLTETVENFFVRRLSGLVSAEPVVMERGGRLHPQRVLVQNFPKPEEFEGIQGPPWAGRAMRAAYVGSVTEMRGIREMVGAMALLPGKLGARLAVAGAFSPPGLEAEMSRLPGWDRVDVLGSLDRRGVARALSEARVGILVLQPNPFYEANFPVKLFEYMISGLPVLASDFPVLRRIIQENGCGLLADPRDPGALASALEWLLVHDQEAEAMGRRGREAVLRRYRWDMEEKKLLSFYDQVLGGRNAQG